MTGNPPLVLLIYSEFSMNFEGPKTVKKADIRFQQEKHTEGKRKLTELHDRVDRSRAWFPLQGKCHHHDTKTKRL